MMTTTSGWVVVVVVVVRTWSRRRSVLPPLTCSLILPRNQQQCRAQARLCSIPRSHRHHQHHHHHPPQAILPRLPLLSPLPASTVVSPTPLPPPPPRPPCITAYPPSYTK